MTLAANLHSVIALSKLYSLNDARVAQTMVKGDLIVPTSDRIMTRSRAKQSMLIHAPLRKALSLPLSDIPFRP
jgi:hypothetical protein